MKQTSTGSSRPASRTAVEQAVLCHEANQHRLFQAGAPFARRKPNSSTPDDYEANRDFVQVRCPE